MSNSVTGDANLGRVMVLGSHGMVGSACIRVLHKQSNLSEIIPVSRDRVDLMNQAKTFEYIAFERPDWVIVAAAKVGGIHANNTYPADFIYQNLTIQNNVIEGAFRAGVEKLVFLGSSCIYPKYSEQPIREEALLTGILESTNEPYAVSKIAGIKMCESYNRQYGTDYRSLMPTNIYGPGDNYHSINSHVIPALIRRFHEAKLNDERIVEVWGTGKARREFLFVDDLAEAVTHVMALSKDLLTPLYSERCCHLNVGFGDDVTIDELANLIGRETGFLGEIRFNKGMPDGTPRKLLDVSKLTSVGWKASTSLDDGLKETYEAFSRLCSS